MTRLILISANTKRTKMIYELIESPWFLINYRLLWDSVTIAWKFTLGHRGIEQTLCLLLWLTLLRNWFDMANKQSIWKMDITITIPVCRLLAAGKQSKESKGHASDQTKSSIRINISNIRGSLVWQFQLQSHPPDGSNIIGQILLLSVLYFFLLIIVLISNIDRCQMPC